MKSKNIISELIKRKTIWFHSFCSVYLFGSILSLKSQPNDIDLLLIYEKESENIYKDLNFLRIEIENICKLPPHLTVLSVEEENDIKFLEKIKYCCKKIK